MLTSFRYKSPCLLLHSCSTGEIPTAGRYIQKHPGHGPGGIDFSLSPTALAALLRHCQGSTLAPAVALALAPQLELRGTAQQVLEELNLRDAEKVGPGFDGLFQLILVISPSKLMWYPGRMGIYFDTWACLRT